MIRASSDYFIDTRDTAAWRTRGLMALYGFGVASLLAAVVTFIAHNWTYLGTGLKLGGLGVALILCAGMWVLKGFDGRSAQSFGVAAQVLIGVWLAAAGQIYQAPGGLQDLLMIWAGLGLPFALASRSPAHWAVWFGIIGMASLSPIGLTLGSAIGPDWKAYVLMVGGLIVSVGLMATLYKRGPIWLSGVLALELSVLLIGASWIALFEPNWLGAYGPSFCALIILLGVCRSAYQQRRVSTTSLLISAVLVVVVSALGHLLSDGIGDGVLFYFIMTGLVCGGTYCLVLIFKHLRELMSANTETTAPTDDNIPWYMDALVGVGGVMTAVFACVLIGTIISLSGLLDQNWGASSFGIGLGVYSLSILMQRRSSGQFLRFLFGTFILVGIICLTAGIGEMLSDSMSAGFMLLTLSIVTALVAPGDRVLSSLMAVTACVGIAWIITGFMPGNESTLILLGIYSVCGLVFGTVVLRGRVHLGIAAVFLIAAIAAEFIVLDYRGSDADIGWTVINIVFAIVGGLWLWFHYVRSMGPNLPTLIMLMVIAIILPVGAVPAMLLLILAYSVGSRPLFLIGLVAMAWFLFSAYFDLSMTLMTLSGVMAAVGLGLLGLWAFASKRVEIAS